MSFDVAVIGVPDERWAKAVKAIVVPASGASPGEDALIASARARALRAPYWAGVDRRIR